MESNGILIICKRLGGVNDVLSIIIYVLILHFTHDLLLLVYLGNGDNLPPWPSRMLSASPRLKELGVSNGHFQKDKVMINPEFNFTKAFIKMILKHR